MICDEVERDARMSVFGVLGPIKRDHHAAAGADEPRDGAQENVIKPNLRVAQQTVDLFDSVLWHHAVGTGQAAANISDTEATCKHGSDRGLRHRKRTLSMHAWRKKVNQKFGHEFDRNGRVWILVFFVHGWQNAANTKRENLAPKSKFLQQMRGSLRAGSRYPVVASLSVGIRIVKPPSPVAAIPHLLVLAIPSGKANEPQRWFRGGA